MFIHFSIMMIVTKKKHIKFDQESYDLLFYNIENDLRELGYGDIAVNKKMKELNKILYDILLKLELRSNSGFFKINYKLINKYFIELNDPKSDEFTKLNNYFSKFYDYCFEYSMENMLKAAINFKH
jgi:cytochrome b pre-mRNA-processing protein 3